MQEDAPSCRHPYHEAKNGILSPVSCFLTGILFLFFPCSPAPGMCLSAARFVAVSPSLALPLLYPFPFFPPIFVFVLLPSACVLPSSRLFLFFREGEDPPFHLRQGKNEEGKVTFAFLFLFVCSPEEGKESVLSFLSSSREGERKCVLSVL